jgi:DNA-binding IclR family transcriptional regulator
MAKQKKESAKADGVAAVERALSILGAFREGDTSLTLHEVAERTALYKSTILRLMASLERRGCMLRLGDGSYQLGPMLVRWGSLYLTSVRVETHITPVLAALSRETGESATFYTPQGHARLCLARVDCAHSVRDHVRVGDLLPLERGAGGKVILAYTAAGKERRTQSQPANVITSFRERDPEGAGMAAPVFGADGSLRGAIALSGSAARFNEHALPRFSKAILAAARELTVRFGGDPAPFDSKEMSVRV